MTLGFKLSTAAETGGIGFVPPFPIPDFPGNLRHLHTLRRSARFAGWNNFDLQNIPVTTQFNIAQPERFYSAENRDRARLPFAFTYGTGFTVALAVDTRLTQNTPSPFRSVLRSIDHAVDLSRGLRLRVEGASGFDQRLELRVRKSDGESSAQVNYNFPQGDSFWWVFCRVSSLVRLNIPGLGVAEEGSAWAGSTAPAVPDGGFEIGGINSNSADSDAPTDIGYAAIALWSGALTNGQLATSHQQLIAWAAKLGINSI